MRERIRLLLAACFYYSGLVNLVLWRMQRSGQYLIILNYHRARGDLGTQLRYLRRHYRVMHLEEALEEFFCSHPENSSSKPKQHQRIPLVVTFDDGYLDNYTYGFQLARTLQVPITIFVVPGYIESGAYFWWLAAKKLLSCSIVDKVTIEEKTYYLSVPTEREALLKVMDRRIRYAPSVAEREAFLEMLQKALGVNLPRRGSEAVDDVALPITWEQVREMEESGWVSFGAHTMHHPLLAYLSDAAEVHCEVQESRQLLEAKLGHPVRTFAYPIGKMSHIGDEGLRAVRAAGYDWAVTTIEGVNTRQSDPLLLTRFPGVVEVHWLIMAAELAGLLGVVSRIRKKYERIFKR